MAGGSDNQRFPVPSAKLGHAKCRVMKTEVDHCVAPGDNSTQTVAGVDLPNDLELGNVRNASDQCLPHAALGTGDDDSCL